VLVLKIDPASWKVTGRLVLKTAPVLKIEPEYRKAGKPVLKTVLVLKTEPVYRKNGMKSYFSEQSILPYRFPYVNYLQPTVEKNFPVQVKTNSI
jgi:hypothetical protein